MAFYYSNLFSNALLGVAYLVAALVLGIVWWLTRRVRGRAVIRALAAIVLLLAPVSEELWIAWNFARACEQAGTFINKKVVVDGFYDGTGVSLELVRSGGYRFVEGPRRDGGVEKVTLGDKEFAKDALQRFQQENPGKDPGTQDVVRVKLDDKTEALVFPKRGDSWRIERLDRPTARYQFKDTDPMNGTPWGHKIVRSGSVVIDKSNGEEIARYVGFGRDAPWFFIGLDRPGFACDAPKRWPYTRGNGLIYREVLIPATSK